MVMYFKGVSGMYAKINTESCPKKEKNLVQ